MVTEAGTHRRGQVYAALAALAWSLAGVLQRELSVSTATQIAGRAFFAFFALLLFVLLSERRGIVRPFTTMGAAGWAVTGCTVIATSTFIVALNHTTVANVLFLQALSPLAAALLAWVGLREAVSRRTLMAMVVAIGGVALMVGGPGGARGIGLALSLAMTLAFAVALVITRHRRDVSMGPAMCLAQLVVLIAWAPFSQPGTIGGHDLGVMALLGVVQMAGGLAFVTMAARLIPAAEVALITLLEVVLGPLWVWVFLNEQPGAATLVGGAIVLGAVAIQAGGDAEPQPLAVP